MAIDPTIALGVRPIESPLDSMGKALSIQNMQTQGKMSQLGLQQAQTQMAQQQALNAAYADPANRNPDGSINYQGVSASLAKANAGSQIPGVMKAGMETQKALTDQQLSQMKLMQEHNDRMSDHIQGLMSDTALTPDKVRATMDLSLKNGDLDQAHYQQALQTMPPTADPKALKAWLAQQASTVYATGAKLQQFLPQVKAETVGGQLVPVSTTQATGEVTAGAPLVTTPVSDLGKINQDEKTGLVSAADAAKARNKETHIAANNISVYNAAQTAGDDYEKILSPAEKAAARAIADGGALQPVGTRNPRGNLVNAYAQQLFSDANGGDATGFGTVHGVITKGRESFSPGRPNGQTIIALNTASDHLNLLKIAAQKLNNGDTRGANAILNEMGIQLGSNEATNFNTIADTLAGEIAKVNGAGVVTESGKHEARAAFPQNGSNAQIMGAIDTSLDLMGGKLNALDQDYQRLFGKDLASAGRLTKGALAAFRGVRGKANESPSAQPPTITNQADYDKLPNGASYVDSSGNPHVKGGVR